MSRARRKAHEKWWDDQSTTQQNVWNDRVHAVYELKKTGLTDANVAEKFAGANANDIKMFQKVPCYHIVALVLDEKGRNPNFVVPKEAQEFLKFDELLQKAKEVDGNSKPGVGEKRKVEEDEDDDTDFVEDENEVTEIFINTPGSSRKKRKKKDSKYEAENDAAVKMWKLKVKELQFMLEQSNLNKHSLTLEVQGLLDKFGYWFPCNHKLGHALLILPNGSFVTYELDSEAKMLKKKISPPAKEMIVAALGSNDLKKSDTKYEMFEYSNEGVRLEPLEFTFYLDDMGLRDFVIKYGSVFKTVGKYYTFYAFKYEMPKVERRTQII